MRAPKANDPVWYLQGRESEAAPGPQDSQVHTFQSPAPGLPECADEGRAQGKGGDVLGLLEGPVEGGKSASQDTLAQGQHPVEGPE